MTSCEGCYGQAKAPPDVPRRGPPAFHALMKEHLDGTVTPTTVVGWMKDWLSAKPDHAIYDGHNEQAKMAVLLDTRAKEFIAAVKVQAPIPEDRLLTRSQAAELLIYSPRSACKHVRPVRRCVYRWSDVMVPI